MRTAVGGRALRPLLISYSNPYPAGGACIQASAAQCPPIAAAGAAEQSHWGNWHLGSAAACTPQHQLRACGHQTQGFASAPEAHQPWRNSRFSELTDVDIDRFRDMLGDSGVITEPELLKDYNRCYSHSKYVGIDKVLPRFISPCNMLGNNGVVQNLSPAGLQQGLDGEVPGKQPGRAAARDNSGGLPARSNRRGSQGLLPLPPGPVQVMEYCSGRRLAVVPQGGNSSLAGAAVPVADEVIMSMWAMRNFHSFDEVSGVVVCDAGATLQEVDDYVHEHGFMVPLDLGAKETCHIGGNVATNAGGLRYLRYGSMRANVLGIEAVTPTGQVLDLLSKCRKDNTGYDLKQLFIGSEGTLGVITKVALMCPSEPAAVDTLCLACADWPAVLQAYKAARRHLGEVLSAFEFFDAAALEVALEHVPGLKHPLPGVPVRLFSPLLMHFVQGEFYVIIEAAGSDGASNRQRISRFLSDAQAGSNCGGRGSAATDSSGGSGSSGSGSGGSGSSGGPGSASTDGGSGDDTDCRDSGESSGSGSSDGGFLGGRGTDEQRQADADLIWKVRKNLSEGLRLTAGPVFKYDLSMAPAEMYQLVEETRQRLRHVPGCTTVGYGHLGDGNLHLNVACQADAADEVQRVIEPFVYEYTAARGGSVSAEHGLGQMKTQYMRCDTDHVGQAWFSKPPAAIQLMRQIKNLLDPYGIMNPNKLLPPE